MANDAFSLGAEGLINLAKFRGDDLVYAPLCQLLFAQDDMAGITGATESKVGDVRTRMWDLVVQEGEESKIASKVEGILEHLATIHVVVAQALERDMNEMMSKARVDGQKRDRDEAAALDIGSIMSGLQECDNEEEELVDLFVTEGSTIIDFCTLFPRRCRNREEFKAHMAALQAEEKGYKKKAFKMCVAQMALSAKLTDEEVELVAAAKDGKLSNVAHMIEKVGCHTGMARCMGWKQQMTTPFRLQAVAKFLRVIQEAGYDWRQMDRRLKLIWMRSKSDRMEANKRTRR